MVIIFESYVTIRTVLGVRCDGNTEHLNGLLRCHFGDEVVLVIPPQIFVCHILDVCDEEGSPTLSSSCSCLFSRGSLQSLPLPHQTCSRSRIYLFSFDINE